MQHDEVIWNVINQTFCSFKTKTRKETFCRHVYNVTGLCNRQSCPLANSNYATIREEDGKLYLCIKTIERAHTPKHMWEKIKLKQNYDQALEQVSTHLEYWPKYLVHKCKQRLTKMTQLLRRMRKLQLKTQRRLVAVNKKVERRELRREEKALVAAKITKKIEQELLDRMQSGEYEGVYNFPEEAFEKALDAEEDAAEAEAAAEEELEGEEFVEADVDDEDDEGDEVDFTEFEEWFHDGSDDGEDDEDSEGEEEYDAVAGGDAGAGDEGDETPDGQTAAKRSKKKKKAEKKDDTSAQVSSAVAALLLRRKARATVSVEYEQEDAEAAKES
eukprot:m.8757 g.8757  ORF g.8757 m.8757 type:complete len:330 (+) comp5392_c0_seq1:91-1080(+)